MTNTAVPTSSATCNHQGGAEFKVGTGAATTACNGVTGFTETLPKGKTETGTWSIVIPATEPALNFSIPISFPIPLPEHGEQAFFFTKSQVENAEFGTSGCDWALEDSTAVPKSTNPGTLCVFTAQPLTQTTFNYFAAPGDPLGPAGYAAAGTLMEFSKNGGTGTTSIVGNGVWAVTAPES